MKALDMMQRCLLVYALCMLLFALSECQRFPLTSTVHAEGDTVVQPTCEACKSPDLPWWLEMFCALSC